ncbi:potassium-transporting ATPase KdpC subunit [Actinomycetospora sp. NBRC 106375]|uniref:potassium-transporting ATPase subunit C n=1 Tax=Actinomycetospora sp. NBRC 106375 TaxID=3032207 RepID=UPI0024A005B5|nr:potassium-transporting ATPase subunit C [Actinomycetospora sp. NBRC 106375]GLZ45503.1 potassium-transporting ATPase KdpC subunit [Actinomycetospora sp. NBRC 106375]
MSTVIDSEPTATRESPVTTGQLRRQLAAAVRVLLVLTLLLGVVYPAVVWGVSRLPGLHANAEGSVMPGIGGSSLIGIDPVPANPAADPWFHPRPTASAPDDAVAGLGPADATTSGGSNLGPSSEDLATAVADRRAAIAAREGVDPAVIPPDALTASASGLDPQISPAYAALQVPRVARVTGLGEDRVRALVAAATDGRTFGVLGEPRVNVQELDASLATVVPGIR